MNLENWDSKIEKDCILSNRFHVIMSCRTSENWRLAEYLASQLLVENCQEGYESTSGKNKRKR